jgi:hypothetical protein
MPVRFAPRKVVLLGRPLGVNPFNPAFKHRALVRLFNPGMPKRDHTIRILLNASNFNFSHARSDGLDVRISLGDGVTELGHSPKARSGFYRPLWLSGSSIGALSVTVPWIPDGVSFLYLQYGNPAATDSSDQLHTFKSPVPPSDLILVNAGKIGSKPYLQAQTHIIETLDNKCLQYFGAFSGNSGADGQLWQWVSTDYQSNVNWPQNITFTKLIQPSAGNSVEPLGNACVRANGDIYQVIGYGTNAQVPLNTEPIYVVKRDAVGGGISNPIGTNPLPNPQFAGSLQLNFGAMIEQANGDLWLFMMGTRPTENPGGGGLSPGGGQWSIYIFVCASGADPTNGNNWGLLGGSFTTATVVHGGGLPLTGTVQATNGSTAIVGTGTQFTRQFYQSGYIWITDGAGNNAYQISGAAPADDTHLTLAANYTGPGGSGLAYGLGMSANEYGVAQDASGNIAISFWNNAAGTGVGPVYQTYSRSRIAGVPQWTTPTFLTVPNANLATGNQTDMFLDPNGFLLHSRTRDTANMTIYTSCDWANPAGADPTWQLPLKWNLVIPVDPSIGDSGVSTVSNLRLGVNANLMQSTMYYAPGGSITNTTGNGVSPIVVTAPFSAIANGQSIFIASVLGNTNANGTWTVTRIDDNTFSLNGSTGNGAYISGGTWSITGGVQRNIALITCDLLALVNQNQFLENWDSNSFATNAWTFHTNEALVNTQLLNGRSFEALGTTSPSLEKDGVVRSGAAQTAMSLWFYTTAGNPAFAISRFGERYVWLSGAAPYVPKFFDGSTSANTFPTGITVSANAWHHLKLAIDFATAHDANKLTLQATIDGIWLGQGVLVSVSNQLDLYATDFITSATCYVGDIATEPWSDSEPLITVGAEETFK